MPRTRGYTTRQKIDNQHLLITKKCKGIMAENNITQTALAEYLDISRMAVSQQLKSGNVTLSLLIALVNMANTDAVKLEELLRIKD